MSTTTTIVTPATAPVCGVPATHRAVTSVGGGWREPFGLTVSRFARSVGAGNQIAAGPIAPAGPRHGTAMPAGGSLASVGVRTHRDRGYERFGATHTIPTITSDSEPSSRSRVSSNG